MLHSPNEFITFAVLIYLLDLIIISQIGYEKYPDYWLYWSNRNGANDGFA